MQVLKLISGGQTGADRGGLRAARRVGLEYGGFVPKGRRAEDGRVPAEFEGLVETDSALYAVRTEQNVLCSDATVVFTRGPLRGGSLEVHAAAETYGRPVRWVDLADGRPAGEHAVGLRLWLDALPDVGSGTVNVAGQRASLAPGIEEEVENVLVFALHAAPEVALLRQALTTALAQVAATDAQVHDAR